jgi:hypothetical protein
MEDGSGLVVPIPTCADKPVAKRRQLVMINTIFLMA